MKINKTSLFPLGFFFLAIATFANESSLPLVTQNQMETDSDGWVRATSGDPYLVFNAHNTSISNELILLVNISAQHVLNRQIYLELFWATNSHGFTEAKKGFYIQPFNVKSEEVIPIALNFGEFLEVFGEPKEDKLQLIRLDFDPRISGQDFRVKTELKLLTDPSQLPPKTRDIQIHPTYINRHIMDAEIFKYTVKSLVGDFSRKFLRDPVFLIFYFGMIFALLGGVIYVARAKKLFGKTL